MTKPPRRQPPKKPQALKPPAPKKTVSAPAAPWMPFVVATEEEHIDAPGILRKADISALYAVANGVANVDQQKRCILAFHKLCRSGDMPYRPDSAGGDRDTAFASGMLWVGMQLNKAINRHALYLKD